MAAATDFINGRFPLGVQDFPVKNTSGGSLAAGTTVKLDTTGANVIGGSSTAQVVAVIPTAAISDMPFGVLVETIPSNGIGRCQTVDGSAVWAIALGAISAGAQVGPSATAGQITTYTAANPSLGMALSAAVNAADPVLVKLNISKNA